MLRALLPRRSKEVRRRAAWMDRPMPSIRCRRRDHSAAVDGARHGRAAPAPRARPITPEEVARFALLPLRLEAASLIEEVDAFLADGASVETICLGLLAPAARRLGEMWERDECDFLDVTMGLWRLQEVMRDIAARSPAVPGGITLPYTALFSPMPGDHHNFGTLMIEEVFARAGWRSEALVKPERRELLDRVARKPFDVVGLTLAAIALAQPSHLIKAMRTYRPILTSSCLSAANDQRDPEWRQRLRGRYGHRCACRARAGPNLSETAAARDLNLR